jgi:hypothetical protein
MLMSVSEPPLRYKRILSISCNDIRQGKKTPLGMATLWSSSARGAKNPRALFTVYKTSIYWMHTQ